MAETRSRHLSRYLHLLYLHLFLHLNKLTSKSTKNSCQYKNHYRQYSPSPHPSQRYFLICSLDLFGMLVIVEAVKLKGLELLLLHLADGRYLAIHVETALLREGSALQLTGIQRKSWTPLKGVLLSDWLATLGGSCGLSSRDRFSGKGFVDIFEEMSGRRV